MPVIRVSISLSYALRLSEGEYQTASDGESVHISIPPQEKQNTVIKPFAQWIGSNPSIPKEPRSLTIISAIFTHEDIADPDEKQRVRVQDTERLLRRTNRLLRWYRATHQKADITELTRAQASPFQFEVVDGTPEGWIEPIDYEETKLTPLTLTVEELTNQVRAGLASGKDPSVEVLFLLDAKQALRQGRFREAILFCWSTIDSVFNQKYDQLVNTELAAEWAEAREFFTGYDFGLRNKMSAGMHLLADRSLFRESSDFWASMSASYSKRNGIIHRGENANEDDARQAIDVAQRIIAIMNSIAIS